MNSKPIKGYEGLYEIDQAGGVTSLPRKTLGRWGTRKTSPGKHLKWDLDKTGYARIQLSKDGKIGRFLIHRLVAQTFLPVVEGKSNVNHKDANRLNNNIDNLEWCTFKENSEHMVRLGRTVRKHHLCTTEKCMKPHKALGLCDMHYARHLRAEQRKRAGI